MANAVSHDQNFKNLILDYPRDALAFFAAAATSQRDVAPDLESARCDRGSRPLPSWSCERWRISPNCGLYRPPVTTPRRP